MKSRILHSIQHIASNWRNLALGWIKDTDDKGPYPEDEPNLRFTYERWGDEKCINPEYDPFRVNK